MGKVSVCRPLLTLNGVGLGFRLWVWTAMCVLFMAPCADDGYLQVAEGVECPYHCVARCAIKPTPPNEDRATGYFNRGLVGEDAEIV